MSFFTAEKKIELEKKMKNPIIPEEKGLQVKKKNKFNKSLELKKQKTYIRYVSARQRI